MAAAVTTGVVSLMIEAARTTSRQTPTPNTIKSALEFTAVQLAGFDTLTQGAGSLNANGAIRLIETLDLGAPEGDWWLTTPAQCPRSTRQAAPRSPGRNASFSAFFKALSPSPRGLRLTIPSDDPNEEQQPSLWDRDIGGRPS